MCILYDNPREVGADRIACAIAAYARYGGPTIVVDFGTATTFTAVSAEGDFLGGAIAPGIGISVDALALHAAQLRKVEITRPPSVIARATVAAMQSGVYWGYVGLIDGLITRIKTEYRKPMTVVATGGLSHLFRPDIPAIEHFDPDITIRGLMLIHARNAKQA